MINAKTQKEIDRLSDDLISNFAPPEFVPGCKVTAITDKDEYATDNGWIVAICGRHNNQRCRWTGQLSSIAINDYVDVLYYPSYKLFVVFGQGGTSAAQSGKYLLTDGTRDSTGEQDFTAGIKTDDIAESTAAAGVTIDGVELKDSDIRDNTNETYGLFANIRTNLFSGGGSLYSHFRGSLPAGFSWAGSPFATPTVSYTSGSYLNSSVNNSGAFLQKSMSGNPNIVTRVSVAVTFLEVGCRVDDGTNNNYAEWLLSISAVGVASLIARVALSGTPSSTSYDFNISAWDYITLALRYTGTAMQGFVINEEGEFFYAALKSGTFTPARAGIVNRSADATARIAKYDWFQGDF